MDANTFQRGRWLRLVGRAARNAFVIALISPLVLFFWVVLPVWVFVIWLTASLGSGLLFRIFLARPARERDDRATRR
jgi:hypothetical protein